MLDSASGTRFCCSLEKVGMEGGEGGKRDKLSGANPGLDRGAIGTKLASFLFGIVLAA